MVDAINYGDTYQMPPKSKLPDREIATLTEWIRRGVPWGIETRAGKVLPAAAGPAPKSDRLSKEEFKERARYWSFQPIKPVAPPEPRTIGSKWATQPDRSVHSGQASGARTVTGGPRPTGGL